MNLGKIIGMGLFFTASASASAHADIVCQSKNPNTSPLTVTVHLQPSKSILVPGEVLERIGVTHLQQDNENMTFKSVFYESKQYLRIGYDKSFASKLDENKTLHISARSFQNEGKLGAFFGSLTYYKGTPGEKIFYLSCK